MKTGFDVLRVWTCLLFLLYSSEVLKPASAQDEESFPTMQQFKTAEMADAVMGTEGAIHTAELSALLPKPHLLSPPCEEDQCDAEEEVSEEVLLHGYVSGPEENATKTFKVSCDKRNITGINLFSVHVLTDTQDLMEFLSPNSSECSVVLFFTSWCQFSASLAPHFNALPRVFPSMHFLALDASHHSSLSTRFGTVAVPNILLFQGVKPMARFNHTERTLHTLSSFICNQTGSVAGPDLSVTDQDLEGPLRARPQQRVDWLLVFSVLFITGFSLYASLHTDTLSWLLPGHDHQD